MQFDGGYAGNVSAQQAFDELTSEPNSALVDVRTQAEWAFVGVPDLSPVGKETLFVEWQTFPSTGPRSEFAENVAANVAKLGLDQTASLYFLCRSGARSQGAAAALTQHGFAKCYNVTDGFEGPLDDAGHRGTRSGWKVSGLPWLQK